MVDLSHRISGLHYGEDSEELRTLRENVEKRPESTWSPLVGTIAQQPMVIFGGQLLQLGFYSAYYTDVTPISIVNLAGDIFHTL